MIAVGDFDGQLQQEIGLERFTGDAVFQGQAIQVFHHDESLAVLLVDFVDGADVGVVQRRSGAGFVLKSLQPLGVRGNLFGKELESGETSKLDVFRLVDNTHAAAAKFSTMR